jgi:hypothetical protein
MTTERNRIAVNQSLTEDAVDALIWNGMKETDLEIDDERLSTEAWNVTGGNLARVAAHPRHRRTVRRGAGLLLDGIARNNIHPQHSDGVAPASRSNGP